MINIWKSIKKFLKLLKLNAMGFLPPPGITDPTLSNEFKHLQNKPHCPDCGCYHLKLIDNCDGLPWLKGHVQEIDYFECQVCRRVFNDEDWKNAKHFDNAPANND